MGAAVSADFMVSARLLGSADLRPVRRMSRCLTVPGVVVEPPSSTTKAKVQSTAQTSAIMKRLADGAAMSGRVKLPSSVAGGHTGRRERRAAS